MGEGCLALRGQHMHGGMRKIIETAGVIEIEVREHDVPHIPSVEAQSLDLADAVISSRNSGDMSPRKKRLNRAGGSAASRSP